MTDATSITAAVLAAAVGATPAFAKDFIYTSHSPAAIHDHWVMENYFERVAPSMPEGTNFRVIPGGAVASATNAISAVASGSADSGILIYAYAPSEIPAMALIGDMPGPETLVSSAATTATMLLDCPQCAAEMEKVGIKFLTNMATDTYDVICRDHNVFEAEDFKGIRTRGSGAIGRFVNFIGGTTVNITYGEVYEAMQRGQIDCALLGASVFAQINLWDVANTVTELSLGTYNAYGLITVNMDVWNDFPVSAKRAWLDNIPLAMTEHSREVLRIRDEAVSTATSEHGLVVNQPSDELAAAARAFSETQFDSAVKAATERGVENPEAVVKAYKANFAKWDNIIRDIGDAPWSDAQWDRYTQALHDNIYSQISVE